MSEEVLEIVRRLRSHAGVVGVMVMDQQERVLFADMEEEVKTNAGVIASLCAKAGSTVRTLDPQDELTFLRVRSKKHEIMIAPDRNYLLVVIQDPTHLRKQKGMEIP